jgi:D-lactate dehydrogenase (cytochrome)
VDVLKEQICTIVGRDNIIVDPEGLQEYATENISCIPLRCPLLVVRPGTVEEIQAILQIANRNAMPITPFSSSTNGHGASIPTVPGITIDLRRLNKIHRVDEVCRNAIIEPGVTFAQLQEKAREKGLRTLSPIELPSTSSVLSTYLEMTPLFSWPKYGTETVLTMEVLIPNGDLVKTGMAAIPVIETPYFPFGTIPSYFNKLWFGAQGTLGVVTKGTVKLKTISDVRDLICIPFKTIEESFPVIREIKRLDCAVEFFIANATYLASLLSENGKIFTALRESLPPVTAILTLRGEKEQVHYQREDLNDLGKRMGIVLDDTLPPDEEAREKLLDEIELPMGYQRFKKMKGSYHVIPFIALTQQVPLFNQIVSRAAQELEFDLHNIGMMLLPVEPSRVHYQYSLYVDADNQKECATAKRLFETVSRTLIKMGAFFSRPYGEWAGLVYEKASSYKTMLRKIKREVDPHHIMNPGKLNL